MAPPLSLREADEAFAPLARYPHLAIAVSGGPDSLAALHLIARWRAEAGDRPLVTVLTVDHGLRSGARDEALMVQRVAAGLGLPHAILPWLPAEAGGGGLQARAREARYDLMAAYCHAHAIPALVTAHHLDDQAETFLMRLKRGSGLDGLAAIPEASAWAGIALLRPLLDVPKARLLATLAEAGIVWAEDPSNDDVRFERARVRANRDALAMLGLTPAALARSARRLRRARAALDQATAAFLEANAVLNDAGYCLLPLKALADAPEEIALRALTSVLGAVRGRGETVRAEPVRLAKLEALLAGLRNDPDKTHTLGGCRLEPLGAMLGVFREARRPGLPAIQLAPGERALWDNRFTVALSEGEGRAVTVRALGKAGFRALAASTPSLARLPRLAGATLPACWQGEALILVPRLELGKASPGAPALGFSARFVHAGLAGLRPQGAPQAVDEACTPSA
jgi:tRNA(Ile)-lysidine synthase